MSDSVDPIARKDAALANQKIDSHEHNCADRWREARDQMRVLNNRIWWIVGVLVAGQSAVILMLARKL